MAHEKREKDAGGKAQVKEIVEAAAWDAAAEGATVPVREGTRFRGSFVAGIVKGARVKPASEP